MKFAIIFDPFLWFYPQRKFFFFFQSNNQQLSFFPRTYLNQVVTFIAFDSIMSVYSFLPSAALRINHCTRQR